MPCERVPVKGSVSAVGSMPSSPLGNALLINPGSVVRGNVSATLINEVTINSFSGTGATINGSLTVTDSGSLVGAFVDIVGTVQGNVNVTGTNVGDIVAVDSPLVGPAGFVGGNMAVSLGSGPNIVDMRPGTTVAGNLTINAGGGANSIGSPFDGFHGTVFGNTYVNLGGGNDTINMAPDSTFFGSLSLNVGNGADLIMVNSTLFSTLRMTLGNGNDTVSVTDAVFGPPSITFYLNAGNGDDSIFLSAPTGALFNVNFHTGTGSDTLTLDAANVGSITGSVISHLPGGNEFDQNGWTIVPPWTLIW